MTTTKRPFINPWLLVGLLWVVAMLNYLDRQVIFSLFPLLEEEFAATGLELGLISTVFLWVYGFVSPFAGYMADRFGRVRIILFGLIIWSAATWVTGHVSSIQGMLWARAVMGLSEACYIPAALALIVEVHSEKSRGLAVGLHQSGLYTGVVLGGVWGGWMGDNHGWRPVFTILGAVGVAYFLLLWWLLSRRGKEAVGDARKPDLLGSFRQLLSTKGFLILTVVFTGFATTNWLIYAWLPTYLRENFQLSMTGAGFAATFYIQAASYVGIFVGGAVADRWSQRNKKGRIYTEAIGLGIGAPFLLLLGMTSSYPLLVIALLVYGLGRGFFDANAMPVLSQIAPSHLRATGYGIFNLAGCIVGGVTTAFAGFFKQALGLSSAFTLAAALSLFCALLVLLVKPAPASVIGEEPR